MKLREHLSKGIWTAADKGLLLLNGFAILLIVVHVLPDREWGVYNIFQSIFLIICFIADSIFLQPMVKFASEHKAEVREVLAASFNLYVASMALGALLCIGTMNFLADFLNSPEMLILIPWLALWLGMNVFRNVGIRYLQIFYRLGAIFWVDFAFFGSIIVMSIVGAKLGYLNTSLDFVKINIIGSILSSVVAFVLGRDGFLKMPIFKVPRDEYGKLLSFAKYQAGTSVLQQLQQWSDNLIITIYYSPKEVALYASAKALYRVLDAVKEGATLLIVPIASRLYTSGDKKRLSTLVEQLLFLSFILLVPASLFLAFGADWVTGIIFKGKFPGIDKVFQILILSGIVLPLSLVATNVLIGMGRARGLFLSMLGGTIVFFILNRILVPQYASLGAAYSVLGSVAAIGVFSYISMRQELSISTRGIVKNAKEIRHILKKDDA